MPLTSSFWVDEAETAFIVHHGVDHPSLAVIAPAVQSVYYWLPRASEAIFGFSEAVERLPSLIALAIALFFIGLLAARLIHPQAAWFAVFACLTLRLFNYEAADARAYALGTCVAAASLWTLIRWLDSGKWLDGILFLAAGALLWRVHLVYWPFYFVYAIYFLARPDRRASWVQVITITARSGVGVVARGDIGAGDEPGRSAARVRPAAYVVRTRGNVQDSPGSGLRHWARGFWLAGGTGLVWTRRRVGPPSLSSPVGGWCSPLACLPIRISAESAYSRRVMCRSRCRVRRWLLPRPPPSSFRNRNGNR